MCEKHQLLQCRLCLRNKKSMVSIFKENGRNNCAIKQAIEDLLNLEVSNTDGLPPTICCDCCSKIMGYKAFKAMCLKSKEILWRKVQEKLLMGGSADTSIASTYHEEVGYSIQSKVLVDNSHALINTCLKREPSEDAEQEKNGCDLLLGNTQSLECNGIMDSIQSVKDPEENDSLSFASTLVRYDDQDEESIQLRLQSSSSEVSDDNESQIGDLNDLKPSGVNDDSRNKLYGQPVTECRVILTRLDIDKYKELEKKRHHRKRRMSTCVTSTAQPQIETSPRSHGGSAYPCSDCWITFSSPEFLLKHKKYFHGNFCPVSDGKFNETNSRINELNDRILRGASGQTKEKSDLVTQKGATQSNLCDPEKEMSSKIGSSAGVVPNPSGTQSRTKLLVERTKKRLPLEERICPDKKSSTNNGGLVAITPRKKGHVENKDEISERRLYPCKQCPRVFKKSHNLKVHTYIHDGIKPFKCDMCDECFRTKELKLMHQSLHLDEKPYECHVCSKSYRLISSLRKHIVIHSQLKPYKCEQCDKTFKRTEGLRAHERIHTGERPYKCDKCPQAFSHRGNLIAHDRIHTGVRPYECSLCGKTFQGSQVLKNHLKRHKETANPVPSEGINLSCALESPQG